MLPATVPEVPLSYALNEKACSLVFKKIARMGRYPRDEDVWGATFIKGEGHDGTRWKPLDAGLC